MTRNDGRGSDDIEARPTFPQRVHACLRPSVAVHTWRAATQRAPTRLRGCVPSASSTAAPSAQ